MLQLLLFAGILVAINVAVHAVGLAWLVRGLEKRAPKKSGARFSSSIWVLIKVTWWLILIHGLEISIWAMFYRWMGCLPDSEAAFYFAGVTYTTIGYGDVVLSPEWRLLGPIEGMTGILMCGLSTGFFFAVVSELVSRSLPHPIDEE